MHACGRHLIKLQALDDLEQQLKERLRGRRIVFEMGLDSDTVEAAREALAAWAGTNPNGAVVAGTKYPAVLLTYVVGEANARYQHGALWPHLSIRTFETAELRESFEAAIEALNLEPFQQLADEGLRYVTPILAHGGIPVFCARDFWRKLVSDLEEVPGADADELMRRWRSRPTAFVGIDKPVGRFLLYGGDVARNFLDRCIDLAISPKNVVLRDFGLPADVVDAFISLERDDEVQRVDRGLLVPRPRLMLDPWDRSGPYLELPGVPSELGGAHWLLRVGSDETTKIACSRDRQPLPVPPSSNWHIDFVSWPRTRPFDFEGSSGVVLVFDPTNGEHQTSTRAVVLEEAWILEGHDGDLHVESDDGTIGPPKTLETLPPLGGAWSGYILRRLDLHKVQSVRARRPDGTVQIIRVVAPGARAALDREPTAGVASFAGNDVYDELPAISIPRLPGVAASRWTVEVQAGGSVQRRSVSELGGINGPVHLATVVPEEFLGEIQLAVFGPLGFDLRASFAVAPGLRVTDWQDLLLPGDTGEMTIAADPSIAINGGHGPVTLPITAEGSDLQVQLRRGTLELGLRIRVPKLSWALQGPSGAAALASRVIELDASDVRDRKVETLVIATERSGMPVCLDLRDDDREIQTTGFTRTSGERGRWRFALDQFAGTLIESDAPAPEFVLRVGPRAATLVRVHSRAAAKDFAIRFVMRGEARVLRLAYVEEHAIRRRVALLWPLDRPWDRPARSEISDGTVGEAFFLPNEVPPGRYRAQLTVLDGWLDSERPRKNDVNSKDISVAGTPRRSDNARDLLGIALEACKRPIGLRDDAIARLTGELIEAIAFFIGEARNGELPFKACFAARLLLSAAESYPILIDILARGNLSRSSLVQLAVVAFPLKRPDGHVADETLGALWRSCSPLAAMFDVPAARSNDEGALARCRALLGWSRTDGLPMIAEGLAPNGSWLAQSPEQIRSMHAARRVDQGALSMAEYLGASLEWIANARENPDAANGWWDKYGEALALPRPDTDPRMKRYILRRRKAEGLPGTAGIPQATLGGAERLVAGSADAGLAREALWAAAWFAPRLVAYDVTLAILVRSAGPEERSVEPPRPLYSPPPLRQLDPALPLVGPADRHVVGDARDIPATPQEIESVYRLLTEWRQKVMKTRDFYVFTDEDLRKIASRRPRKIDDLSEVIKNPDKIARHGDGILRAIWGIGWVRR